MAHLCNFAACLLLVFTIGLVNCSEQTSSFTDEMLDEFISVRKLEPNPINKLLYRLSKRSIAENSPTKMFTKVYKFGDRVTGENRFIV